MSVLKRTNLAEPQSFSPVTLDSQAAGVDVEKISAQSEGQ